MLIFAQAMLVICYRRDNLAKITQPIWKYPGAGVVVGPGSGRSATLE
jgi:hypothetical protein